jgi:hypothetical protein
MKNVNIVVLRVMTLTIVLITLNFVPTNLPTNKDGKGKGGHRGHNSFQSKGKISHVKPQVKPMTKAKVVAWPLHKINLFN